MIKSREHLKDLIAFLLDYWIHHFKTHAQRRPIQRTHNSSLAPKKNNGVSSVEKMKTSVLGDVKGIVFVFYQKGSTIKEEYDVNLLRQIRKAIKNQTFLKEKKTSKEAVLHQDYAPACCSFRWLHYATSAWTFDHPLYSLDLLKSEYHPFLQNGETLAFEAVTQW